MCFPGRTARCVHAAKNLCLHTSIRTCFHYIVGYRLVILSSDLHRDDRKGRGCGKKDGAPNKKMVPPISIALFKKNLSCIPNCLKTSLTVILYMYRPISTVTKNISRRRSESAYIRQVGDSGNAPFRKFCQG